MSIRTPAEPVKRNIDAAFAVAEAIIDTPALEDAIPDGATVIFISNDDPASLDENIALGIAAIRSGENVYFMHVHKHLQPR
jgi:hypothetical protein